MTNRHTSAHAKDSDGNEVAVQSTQSDAPIIPIGSIERLHSIRPDRVDWVFEQTQIEAETRRIEDHRVNTFVFIERMAAMVVSAAIGICGIVGGIYAGLNGQPWLGGIISTATIGTLAVSYLKRPQKKQQ